MNNDFNCFSFPIARDALVAGVSKFICSSLGSRFTTTFRFKASIALLTSLLCPQIILFHLLLLISPCLRVILFNNDTVLELFSFQIVQVLSLDNILKTAFIAIAFELVEQVQFMALKLLNTLIESGDRIEHLVMLVLKFEPLLLSFDQFLLDHNDLVLEGPVASLLLVKVLLDVRSRRDSLH